VSAIVAYNIILNDHQVAFMAPTEILANQHFVNFNRLLTGKKINIGLLTKGKFLFNQKVITKQKLLRALKNHQVDLLIGTHALIQEKVVFDSLALAIIDEQHRFGVEQRKILNQKSNDKNVAPHFLSMTATPIPRSLALSFYGNLDLTTIKTLPANRKKIITKVVRSKQRQKIYQFVSQEIKAGRQVFFVCPLIDPSDKLTAKSVKEEFIFLKEKIWPQFRVGLLHGRLKMEEKEKIMNQFVDHQIDILVATSVIEVGIDVPNASVMIIENAERFGLAQLHQLRGRVGRGESQSYCFLLTEKNDPKTIDRLTALTQSNNGFELAEKDLEFRGPGEFFGVSQSGWPEFRIASLFDFQFLKIVNEAVKKIIDQDPNLDNHPLLKEKVYQSRMATHLE
ncbi:MAG: DEAD/DEAH box helicase, partial [Candidatus Buchananbacteria bacterium]|nr:DEAD/DEAH box helicase [Candidatus Buchananbacteria bacterium]